MTRCDSVRLTRDAKRVIAKPFVPPAEISVDGTTRVEAVMRRIAAMSDRDVSDTLAATRAAFTARHRDLDAVFARSFEAVAPVLARLELDPATLADERRRLIGAYFTHEYSVESAALCNPSIVAAPDQSGVDPGDVRFVMSLRSIGEGHVSSIEFRTGIITAEAGVRLDPTGDHITTGRRDAHGLDKSLFTTTLRELGTMNEVAGRVLDRLADRFAIGELETAIDALDADGIPPSISGETTRLMHWLASSNYRVGYPGGPGLSERVLFPSGPTESHGMEDARFVRFVGDDGATTYYATYTAYDGHQILPQLLETADFTEFRVSTLVGRAARNKGIALFPRRIDGRFVALGRHDNVNNYIMRSDDIRVWNDATLVQEPERPWELMQLGNCGSPLETSAGWLVITHGVGPFRRYTLGALLLDRDDPTRVLGHLDEPLLEPDDDERDGYVPNVVYSCGSMIHGDHLVIPYGYGDVGTRLATTPLGELLDRLTG